jgi:hypothetical protein
VIADALEAAYPWIGWSFLASMLIAFVVMILVLWHLTNNRK